MPGTTRCSRPRPRWPRPSRNSSAGTDRDDRHGQAGHRGGVRPRDLHRWGAVRRPCQAAPRQPGGLGRRGPGPGLAGRTRVLAGAAARRRRVGDAAAAALLLVARRDPDPRPGDTGRARLRPRHDAEHGPAGPFPAADAARQIVHAARGRAARRAHPRARANPVRAGVRRARPAGRVRLCQGRRRGPAAADPRGRARHAGAGPVAAVRLVQPGDRLPGSRLRRVRRVRPVRPVPDASGRMPDPRTRDGMPDLYAYAHLLADAKRRDPGDDVMSILLAQVDDEGGRVSVEEFENMFWLFAVAGNETIRNGLPGACIALLEHPEAQDALRADPGLMPAAAEEMLRWWTPVMTFRRTATADCELGGQPIRAGDKVVVS